MRRILTKIFLFTIIIVAVSATINSKSISAQVRTIYNLITSEKDRPAPVDYGYGPGAPIGPPRGTNFGIGRTPAVPKTLAAAAAVGIVPAAQGGSFSLPFAWPIIPIHVALLPDGRVLNFGTDQGGVQGAQLVYDIWDPKLGNGAGAHTILPNTTATDVFCGVASLLGNGNILMAGGDLTVGGVRNYSNNEVTVFNPTDNSITKKAGKMQYPRWYPSITTLSNGDKLVLGGRLSPGAIPGQTSGTGAPTPEVRSSTNGWRQLQGISITNGTDIEWYYPRGFVGANNAVYVLRYDGTISMLTTDDPGTSQDFGSLLDRSLFYYPSLMTVANGNPFSVLSVRFNRQVEVVDISNSPPTVTRVGSLAYDRIWGNATLLPDGEVLMSGGSGADNALTNVALPVELYNPSTATWTLGASAAKPRLYHSSTLLLPDGSVLTAGGGAPAPVGGSNQQNAEIYYPPYLYAKDGSGNPATRPNIIFAPSTLNLNQTFTVTMGANDTVGAINLIRVGANTHTFNSEQRIIPVGFFQNGTNITATLQAPSQLAPRGYYMLFVLNRLGVPSVAKILSVL